MYINSSNFPKWTRHTFGKVPRQGCFSHMFINVCRFFEWCNACRHLINNWFNVVNLDISVPIEKGQDAYRICIQKFPSTLAEEKKL